MRTKLNVLIGLHFIIVILLVVLVRLTFSIFYYSLPDHRRCGWNWTDGKSADQCQSEQLRRGAAMTAAPAENEFPEILSVD